MDLMVSQIPRKNGATAAQTVLISSHAALKAAGIECITDTEEAVRKAVAYAKEAKNQ